MTDPRCSHGHHHRTTDRAADPAASAEDIARRVVAEERARIAGIYDAARKLGLDPAVADTLVRDGVALDQARGLLIDQAAERDRAVETRPHIRTGGLDEREIRRGRGGDGAAAPLRSAPLCAQRAGPRLARLFA